MKWTITIEIEGTPEGAKYARSEIIGSIMDAEDSDELGGCEVTWGDLEELKEPEPS